ncbi:MAG TPA: hypothetical protein VMO75_05800 [Chthoniobacterales bacterium]|nr:hypothetical protein [Chthoniobacterales bacterium]
MDSPLQKELFDAPDTCEWQAVQSAAGGELRYKVDGRNLILVDFDGDILKVTKQSQDRYFARLPDGTERRIRGFRNFVELIVAAREARRAIDNRKQAQALEEQAVGRVLTIAETAFEQQDRESRPRSRNKLAKARQLSDQKRYINPFKDRSTFFNRVPVWLESKPDPSPLEKLVYGRLTFPTRIQKNESGEKICGFCDGWNESTGAIFGIELTLLAKALGAGRTATSTAFESLGNRNLIEIGNWRKRGLSKTVRFLQHPWQGQSCTLSVQLAGSEDARLLDNGSPLSDGSCPVSGELSLALKKERTQERLIDYSSQKAGPVIGEKELLDQVRAIVGDKEMRGHGGGWRMRIRRCKRAVEFAIEDWKLRTPDQQRLIKNRAAWLTDRHARALVEIDNANKSKKNSSSTPA